MYFLLVRSSIDPTFYSIFQARSKYKMTGGGGGLGGIERAAGGGRV